MSLSAYIDHLVKEKNYSPHTVMAYKRDLVFFGDYMLDAFDLHKLEEVNYGMIRSWIVSMVDAGMSNRSINRKIASLNSYYTFLLRTGDIDEHPLTKHKALKTSTKVQLPFSQKEVESVLQELEEPADRRGRDHDGESHSGTFDFDSGNPPGSRPASPSAIARR